MSGGGFDQGYSFESGRSDTWKQRWRGGRGSAPPAADPRPNFAPNTPEGITPPDVHPVTARAGQKSEVAKPNPLACHGDHNKRYREAWEAYRLEAEDYDKTGKLDAERSRPEPPEVAFWYGEPVWCPQCASEIGLKLAQLDYLAGLLAATADGHRGSGEPERVSGSQAASPSPSQAADDLDEMWVMLSSWEEIYRALKGWGSGPQHGELATRETECVNWLQRHLRGILASEIGGDFGREILQWHREGTGNAKAGVRTVRKPLRCPSPSCRQLTLFWTEGEKNVYCKNEDCGRVLSLAEYEDEAAQMAGRLARGEEDEDAEREAS